MEGKKSSKLKSDKSLPNVIKNDKNEANITRTKKKSKIIIDNLTSMQSNYKYSEYLDQKDQNAEFCDYMEDCLISINNFNKESYLHLFYIFDGHGGNITAKLCVKKFPEIFRKCLLESPFDYEMALKKNFYLMDKELEKLKALEVGNTTTVVFINNELFYCANFGDSSCTLLGKTNEFITT